MTQTVDRGETLRVLAAQEYVAPQAASGSDTTPMGVFEISHYRLDPDAKRSALQKFACFNPLVRAVAGWKAARGWYRAAQRGIGKLATAFHKWGRGQDILLHREIAANLFTTEGRTHLLSVGVCGGTQYSPWYVSPFEANYTPVAGLTAATYTAAATECTAYDEAARVTYVEGTPAAGAVDNAASRAEFTFNATKTIYGAALLSTSTKSATSGVCLCAARFSTARSVIDDDVLEIKYSLSITSS